VSWDSGKFWDIMSPDKDFECGLTDQNQNAFLELLRDILVEEGLRYGWFYSVDHLLTLERYIRFDGQSKLGLTFERFVEIVELEEDNLRSWWCL
jgi:hypothetical protein